MMKKLGNELWYTAPHKLVSVDMPKMRHALPALAMSTFNLVNLDFYRPSYFVTSWTSLQLKPTNNLIGRKKSNFFIGIFEYEKEL